MNERAARPGCVVVAHGEIARILIDAVQGILGTQTGWRAASNSGLGLKDLTAAVERAVDDLSEDFRVVMFADMPGGSCHHVCQELACTRPDLRVVTGVNLIMLLEFFVRRDRHDIDELVRLIQERGRRSICGA